MKIVKEVEEVEILEAVPAAASNISSTPVKVQHVVSSPPHITDHCYARRSRASSSSSSPPPPESRGGLGQGDHDYTKPRTPPRAPAPLPPSKNKVRPKPKTVQRPTLPAKPVKWKKREYAEKLPIIFKFLTDGIDAEDVMYLKRSYEMVSRDTVIL